MVSLFLPIRAITTSDQSSWIYVGLGCILQFSGGDIVKQVDAEIARVRSVIAVK